MCCIVLTVPASYRTHHLNSCLHHKVWLLPSCRSLHFGNWSLKGTSAFSSPNNSMDLNGPEEPLNNYLVISFLVESRENRWKKIGKFLSFLIKPNIMSLMPDIKSSKSSLCH